MTQSLGRHAGDREAWQSCQKGAVTFKKKRTKARRKWEGNPEQAGSTLHVRLPHCPVHTSPECCRHWLDSEATLGLTKTAQTKDVDEDNSFCYHIFTIMYNEYIVKIVQFILCYNVVHTTMCYSKLHFTVYCSKSVKKNLNKRIALFPMWTLENVAFDCTCVSS